MSSLDATLDLLGLFTDASRVRLLALLSREELTVAELVSITELSQSRVSTHLGRLKEAGLLRDRRVGSSTFYKSREDALPGDAKKLWTLLMSEVSDAVLDTDRERCAALLRARQGPRTWPDSIAGQMDRHYSPGRTWEATARGLLGFVRLGDVLDVGAGDGVTAALLAPRSTSFTCLDKSERVIEAARARLSGAPNVRFAVGDMHDLPFAAASFDAVLQFNTLTYASHPKRAVAEAARVLKPGGTLAVVSLAEHQHRCVTEAYSHENNGFSPAALGRMLRGAGLDVTCSEITSREHRKPYFEVVTAFASRPALARVSVRAAALPKKHEARSR